MAINFPDSPTTGDTFTADNRTWVWDGTTWDAATGEVLSVTSPLTFDSSTRTVGITQSALEIAPSQVTGLTASAAALNTVDDGTSGYTALSAGTAGLSYQPVSHNYIINGAFDIWQRGTSFSLTADLYCADRWVVDNRGGTVTVTRTAFEPGELEVPAFGGSDYYANLDFDSSNTNGRFDQRVEGAKTLAGQAVTLSFWAKSVDSSSITAQIIQEQTGTKLSQVASLTTSWQRFEFSATLDSLAGETLVNDFLLVRILTSGETNFDIWGVQLEAGSVATPFKRNAPNLQGELAACQRYYFRYGGEQINQRHGLGAFWTSTTAQIFIQHPVAMRAAPSSLEFSTLALWDYGANYAVTNLTFDTAARNVSNLTATVASGGTQYRPVQLTNGASLNGFLGINAEL